MSDFDTQDARISVLSENDKTRGKIPKSDWAYVLGQSRLVGRTLESIGGEYNATPSAVHYVVKMADKLAKENKLTPSIEKPDGAEASLAMHKAINKARSSSEWSMKKVQTVTEPAKPSQVELMAQQANAMLEDEHCKRLFAATSKTIVDYVAFKAAPDEGAKKEFKDALHEARRALASIELKVEMTAVPARQPAAAASAPAAPAPQRLPEMA